MQNTVTESAREGNETAGQSIFIDVGSLTLDAGLKTLLTREGFHCTASSGSAAVVLAAGDRVNLHAAGTKVVAILDGLSPDLVITTLFAGARSFVLRDEPLDDLVRAIRHTMNGSGWITPALFGSLAAYLLQLPIPRPLTEIPSLTVRQKQVLDLLVAGLSTTDIASRLGISVGTTKLHVSAILQKLGVTCRASAVARATGRQAMPLDQVNL